MIYLLIFIWLIKTNPPPEVGAVVLLLFMIKFIMWLFK
nr:MAG TPA: Membrane fusion protein p14 fusion protein transmembrane domain [Caudoviricetes sp.]